MLGGPGVVPGQQHRPDPQLAQRRHRCPRGGPHRVSHHEDRHRLQRLLVGVGPSLDGVSGFRRTDRDDDGGRPGLLSLLHGGAESLRNLRAHLVDEPARPAHRHPVPLHGSGHAPALVVGESCRCGQGAQALAGGRRDRRGHWVLRGRLHGARQA